MVEQSFNFYHYKFSGWIIFFVLCINFRLDFSFFYQKKDFSFFFIKGKISVSNFNLLCIKSFNFFRLLLKLFLTTIIIIKTYTNNICIFFVFYLQRSYNTVWCGATQSSSFLWCTQNNTIERELMLSMLFFCFCFSG